jgi:hypothetical protein
MNRYTDHQQFAFPEPSPDPLAEHRASEVVTAYRIESICVVARAREDELMRLEEIHRRTGTTPHEL